MKTPLGTEVDLDPGRIVLDGDPDPPAKGAQQPPFSTHVYCGHGRPSQLLLKCCSISSTQLSLLPTDLKLLLLTDSFCRRLKTLLFGFSRILKTLRPVLTLFTRSPKVNRFVRHLEDSDCILRGWP